MIGTLRQRDFALLWTGGLISLIGNWMLLVGLPLEVYRLTGSTLATGTMFMAGLLPRLVLGSVAGVFVDRWDRRQTLIWANLLLALGLLPLLAVRSTEQLWIVYLVAFAQATLAQFVRPAENALLPRLVGEERLVPANALNALNDNLARLAGPPLGGLAVAGIGLGGVALLDAASFLGAAALIALIRGGDGRRATSGGPATAGPWATAWREWVDGLRLVRRERRLAVVFAFLAITGVGEGIIMTLFVPFVTRVLGGGGMEFGWILAAQAVGGLLGGVAIGRFSDAPVPARLLGWGAIGLGGIDLLIFNYPAVLPTVWPALALMVVVGLPAAALSVGGMTLLQTATADEYRGRVFGAVGTTTALAGLIGTAIGGALGDLVGIVALLNIDGVGYVLAGALVLALLRASGGADAERARPGSRESARAA